MNPSCTSVHRENGRKRGGGGERGTSRTRSKFFLVDGLTMDKNALNHLVLYCRSVGKRDHPQKHDAYRHTVLISLKNSTFFKNIRIILIVTRDTFLSKQCFKSNAEFSIP